MPRQVVNLFTIYAILTNNPARVIDFAAVYARADLENNPVPFLALCLMAFVCLIFLFSAFLTLVASVLYVPLLCHIRGNLKEYCCHKIDKRIGEMLRKKSRKRLAKEARREMARALQSKAASAQGGGRQAAAGPTLPTLPDLDDAASEYGGGFAASEYGGFSASELDYAAAAHANYLPPYLPADEYRRSPHAGPVFVSRAPSLASVHQHQHQHHPLHHLHHHNNNLLQHQHPAARPFPGPAYNAPPPPPSEYDSPRIALTPFAGPARYGNLHGRSGSVSSSAGSTAAGRYVR
ncbi:MAG: hypothetical protein BJ554DRAFT_4049 [Olpidium bornovanus]|uniref:Uncharacterized protein n=1 Tax=Olpidium bornovanus TaxID=278681 RepID=A0A8H7ZNP7_9FUNG|nr:MAG: hypothetical protein BJ554DRAFT_4049 [Olpidium bornovanus]